MASIVSGAAGCHHLVSARACVTGDPGYVRVLALRCRAVDDLELRLWYVTRRSISEVNRLVRRSTSATTEAGADFRAGRAFPHSRVLVAESALPAIRLRELDRLHRWLDRISRRRDRGPDHGRGHAPVHIELHLLAHDRLGQPAGADRPGLLRRGNAALALLQDQRHGRALARRHQHARGLLEASTLFCPPMWFAERSRSAGAARIPGARHTRCPRPPSRSPRAWRSVSAF
jgi:hypothetical protein